MGLRRRPPPPSRGGGGRRRRPIVGPPSARQVWIETDAPAKKTCLTMLSLAGLLTGRHQLIQRETTAQHVSCTRNACGKQRGFNPLTKKKRFSQSHFVNPYTTPVIQLQSWTPTIQKANNGKMSQNTENYEDFHHPKRTADANWGRPQVLAVI